MCVTCSMTWQRPDLSTYLVAICALYLHLDFVLDFPFLMFFSLFVFLLIYFLLFLVGWWIGVRIYTYTLGAGDNFWTKLSYANSTCFSFFVALFFQKHRRGTEYTYSWQGEETVFNPLIQVESAAPLRCKSFFS